MTDVAEALSPTPPPVFPPPKRPGGLARMGLRLRGAFFHDLPLKFLALVLAVMAWLVVREKIVTDEVVQDVPVDVVVPESIVVIVPEDRPLVNLRLRGPWSEVSRAKKVLSEGRSIVLRLADLEHQLRSNPPITSGASRPITEASAFTFPFENPEIVTVLRPVTIRWNAIEERTIPLAQPVVLGTSEARVDPSVTMEQTSVRLRGPSSLFRGKEIASITPDPVDASAWLKAKPDLATAWSWESRFDGWRSMDKTLRGPRVLQIQPEVVRGKVKFRATGGRRLEHEVAHTVADPRWTDTHVYEAERSPEYDRDTRVLGTTILAEPAVLDRLEKNPSEWGFHVVLPPPPANGAGNGQHVELPVLLHLPPGVTATLEKTPTLFVTIKKR